MKFSTREDVAAPAEFVFDMLTRFEVLEERGRHHGAEIRHLDTLSEPGLGMHWDIAFPMRGRIRHVDAAIVAFNRAETFSIAGQSTSFTLDLQAVILDLAAHKARVQIGFEILPRNLTARVMLQSAKLGYGRLERRYIKGIRKYIREIEETYRVGQGGAWGVFA